MSNGNYLKVVMLDQWMPFKLLHEQVLDLGLSKYRRKPMKVQGKHKLHELGESFETLLSIQLLWSSSKTHEVIFSILGQIELAEGQPCTWETHLIKAAYKGGKFKVVSNTVLKFYHQLKVYI